MTMCARLWHRSVLRGLLRNIVLWLGCAAGLNYCLMFVSGQSFHGFDQTLRTHIGPIPVDKFKTGGPAGRFMNDPPTIRDFHEARPKGMLSLVVDQNVIYGVLVFE